MLFLLEVLGIILNTVSYLFSHLYSIIIYFIIVILAQNGIVGDAKTAECFYRLGLVNIIIALIRFTFTTVFHILAMSHGMHVMCSMKSQLELLEISKAKPRNSEDYGDMLYKQVTEPVINSVYISRKEDFPIEMMMYIIEAHKAIMYNFCDFMKAAHDNPGNDVKRFHTMHMNAMIAIDCVSKIMKNDKYHHYGFNDLVRYFSIKYSRRLFMRMQFKAILLIEQRNYKHTDKKYFK